MRRYVSWFSVLGLLLTVFGSAPARATELIDFGTGLAGAGGKMTYDGNGGALQGTGILLGVMTAVDTPLNAGVHLATGTAACYIPYLCAQLNFTTGVLDAYSNGVYSFKPGGWFEITGGIPGSGLVNDVLISGTFS